MGNQLSRSDNNALDFTAINVNKGDNRYGGSKDIENDFDKGIVPIYIRFGPLMSSLKNPLSFF